MSLAYLYIHNVAKTLNVEDLRKMFINYVNATGINEVVDIVIDFDCVVEKCIFTKTFSSY